MRSHTYINVTALILGCSLMLKHPWGDVHLIYLYLSGTHALLHTLPANKPSRFTPTQTHIHVPPTTHSHTHAYTCILPTHSPVQPQGRHKK